MKNLSLIHAFSRRALLLGTLTALGLGWSQSYACQGCNLMLTHRLLNGEQPTRHAAEMWSLINRAEGEEAANFRLNLASLTGGTPAAAPAATVAQRSPVRPATTMLAQAAPRPQTPAAPATAAAHRLSIPAGHPFADIIERDRNLGIPETSYVPPGTVPDKRFTLTMQEGAVSIGNGVIYDGFTVNGTIPGPTLIMEEGDVVELTVVNNGEVPHGVSLHAVYTQTSKYFGQIAAGATKSHLFRVNQPGVYMYHCAPGGHAIPMHTLLGQYGMMVVKPKKQKFKMDEVMGRGPDLELFFVQHELYSTGKAAIEGKPDYVMFNGELFRYVSQPIKARPGDFVRVYFLNAGPNVISTFHLVGIIWDYAYWQGMPDPENLLVGGQTVLAGPSDSWVVDFRVPPDEGNYLIVTHAFGSTTRGAIGVLNASRDNERSPTIMADGPSYTPEEFEERRARAVRTISPFKPTADDFANPATLAPGQNKLRVTIVGNSFYPKVAEVPAGTTIEWTNEEVFTFLNGEFSGLHDVKTFEGPEEFWSPMLGHAEKWSITLNQPGEYKYFCVPHPYMEGVIIVK
jgi:nitrite reductase (NO-forming)